MINRRSLIKYAAAGGLAVGAGGVAVASASGAAARGRGDAEVLAVVEKGAHALAFFDVATGERQTTLQLPDYPHEMVVDAGRRFAFIGHYGVRMGSDAGEGGAAVFVVDLHRRKLVNTIDTLPYNRVHGMGIDGRDRVYALSEAKAQLMSFRNPFRDKAPSSVVPTGGEKTHMFAITRDGSRAFVTGLNSNTVSMVKPRDPDFAPVVMSPGLSPEGCSLSPDERTLYVGARKSSAVVAIDTKSMQVTRSQQVEGDPLRVYARPDGGVLMTNIANNTISMLGNDLAEQWRMPFTGTPAGLSFHPRKPIAYVSQFVTNKIAVVDLNARAIVNEFATDVEPDVSAILC